MSRGLIVEDIMSEYQRRHRIRLSCFAYAYEFLDDPLISDSKYDKLSLLIDPNISTGHLVMDEFFRTEFSPHTGMWVRRHPELNKLKRVVQFMRGNKNNLK